MIFQNTNLNSKNYLAKYNLVGLKNTSLNINYLKVINQNLHLIKFDFNREKKRPSLEIIKKTTSENYNVFYFKYPLDFFQGVLLLVFV